MDRSFREWPSFLPLSRVSQFQGVVCTSATKKSRRPVSKHRRVHLRRFRSYREHLEFEWLLLQSGTFTGHSWSTVVCTDKRQRQDTWKVVKRSYIVQMRYRVQDESNLRCFIVGIILAIRLKFIDTTVHRSTTARKRLIRDVKCEMR